MHTRTLGRDGLAVSALGLGCMGLSFALSPAVLAEVPVPGDRYSEHSQRMVDR